jgi:hypothetical protein
MPCATDDALTGLGMPAQMAALVGATTQTALAGVGTAQTGAALIKSKSVELIPTGGNTAYILNTFGLNEPVFLFNNAASAVTALVYPPVGGTIQGGSSNASFSIAQDKGVWMWQYKRNAWAAVLTA